MNSLQLNTPQEMMQVSEMLAKSGYFSDARDAAQAFVKVLAGKEIGFPSFASMTGIHIIKGKPTLGANLMAAAVKRSDKYDYKVKQLDDTTCELIFYENGQEVGNSKFDAEDAKKAGTQNFQKFPKNMLFARAISNGIKFYCPDLFLGTPVYTPDELDTGMSEENAITVEAKPTSNQTVVEENKPKTLNKTQQTSLHKRLGGLKFKKDEHYQLASVSVGREITSFSELTVDEAAATFANAQSVQSGLMKLEDGELVSVEEKIEVDKNTGEIKAKGLGSEPISDGLEEYPPEEDMPF